MTTPTKACEHCEYCGTELDEDGTEEGSDNGAGPRIAHFAATCQDRVHAAFKAWRREYADLRAQLAEAKAWDDGLDDEYTAAIDAAFPTKSGSHEAYATAMRMVGNRRSKGSLVALVNWLLLARDTALSQLAEARAREVAALDLLQRARGAEDAGSARWKADYEEKCRAYSAVYGELTDARRALAAAGALPGVTALVTVDSRGVETDRIAEAERRGRRAGLMELRAEVHAIHEEGNHPGTMAHGWRNACEAALHRIRALLDGPGRETETDRTAK